MNLTRPKGPARRKPHKTRSRPTINEKVSTSEDVAMRRESGRVISMETHPWMVYSSLICTDISTSVATAEFSFSVWIKNSVHSVGRIKHFHS